MLSTLVPYLEVDAKNLKSFNDFIRTQLMIGAGGVLVVVEISAQDQAANDADAAELDQIFDRINEFNNKTIHDLSEKEQAEKEALLQNATKVKARLMMREMKQRRLETKAIEEQRAAWELEQAEKKRQEELDRELRDVNAGLI